VTQVRTTARSMPLTNHSSSKPKHNLKCNMSHGAYAVVMLCVLCVALIAGVAQCFVTDDRDVMFGRVLTSTPVVLCAVLSSQHSSLSQQDDKIPHLQPDQQQEIRQLLDEFAEEFDDRPGRCDAVVHRIQTTDGFVPQHMRPYRVPDAFKMEVDRQIQDLLDKGLIRPSNSPMASPIVCVAKKDDGVPIAGDYRYLNSFTVGDAYLMPTIDEVLRSIGKGQFISTFDARSGFWQIPLAEEHCWLTAFVTHSGFGYHSVSRTLEQHLATLFDLCCGRFMNKKSELMLMRCARAYSSSCLGLFLSITSQFTLLQQKNRQNSPKTPIFRVQGHSRSSMLTPLRSSSPVLVMINSMNVPICNRFHAG